MVDCGWGIMCGCIVDGSQVVVGCDGGGWWVGDHGW